MICPNCGGAGNEVGCDDMGQYFDRICEACQGSGIQRPREVIESNPEHSMLAAIEAIESKKQ